MNPFLYHSSLPAPLGIADYGVDAAQNPYVYNTGALLGRVQVNALSAYNGSLPVPELISFQQNLNLYLTSGSTGYDYWTQDFAYLNLSTGVVFFLDNVWNASSPGAQMGSSSILGNGTFGTSGGRQFYYDVASATLPGDWSRLSFPTNISFEQVAYLSNGLPLVAFEYNDGLGWVTFDIVAFPSALGFTDYGFVVDGYGYEGSGNFFDAELIAGGPGGGSQTTISSTNVLFFLYFWNNYNFQGIVDAYNFGSDTAEGLNDGASAGYYYLGNGSLFAQVTAGSGSLGAIYDHTSIGVVNVTTPLRSGELYINGSDYGPFQGGEANVTVGPGGYTFAVVSHGQTLASEFATVARGSYQDLRLGFGSIFSVTFSETGLPAGTSWSVTLGSTTLTSTSSTILFYATNGSLGYVVGSVPGYRATPVQGPATVSGASIVIDVVWVEQKFTVTFLESGLPAGTRWSVTVVGVLVSGTGSELTLNESAGSYSYEVSGVPGYTANAWSGTFDVVDRNLTVDVSWSVTTYALTFDESGLPAGNPWTVDLVNGSRVSEESATGVNLVFQLPNGTYEFWANATNNYIAFPSHASVSIAGQSNRSLLIFVEEDGTISGTLSPGSALVSVGGNLVTGTSGRFSVNVSAGTYELEALALGFSTYFTNVTVTAGKTTWANVTLAPISTSTSPLSLGGSEAGLLVIIAAIVVVGAIGGLLLLRRGRRRPPATYPPPGAV